MVPSFQFTVRSGYVQRGARTSELIIAAHVAGSRKPRRRRGSRARRTFSTHPPSGSSHKKRIANTSPPNAPAHSHRHYSPLHRSRLSASSPDATQGSRIRADLGTTRNSQDFSTGYAVHNAISRKSLALDSHDLVHGCPGRAAGRLNIVMTPRHMPAPRLDRARHGARVDTRAAGWVRRAVAGAARGRRPRRVRAARGVLSSCNCTPVRASRLSRRTRSSGQPGLKGSAKARATRATG